MLDFLSILVQMHFQEFKRDPSLHQSLHHPPGWVTRKNQAFSDLPGSRGLSLSVLEDGSRKVERLENFMDTSNSTVQKFLCWEFLANILPSRFLLPMPTVTTYRATTVSIVDSTWFVSGKNLARETFSGLGTN